MTSATVSRWSRAFVATGVTFFVCWQLAIVAGVGRPATVFLGLYGFVFSVVFGKAYALLPSYFERELAVAHAPMVHLPLATGGAIGLFAGAVGVASGPGPWSWGFLGALSWFTGCLVFVGTLGWTVRDNLTGRETGTGSVNEHRRRIDRASNAFVPVVFAYLLAGGVLPVLEGLGVDGPISVGPPTTHLLAAGTATLLVFVIGFRLLPRFTVTTPRPFLVALVLPAGAIAPAMLAVDFLGGTTFRLGAVLQVLAVTGFAVTVGDMYRRTDRDRVGFHAVFAGALCGIAAVGLALYVALVGVETGVLEAHVRLAAGGFLGLTIVGVSYQFYPPAIGSTPGVDDRTALVSIALLAGGFGLEALGYLTAMNSVTTVGQYVVLLGALCYAFVIGTIFLEQR
ncbi:hypothetical protein OB955_23505 [Halobacteria archaeon AArc-m2/3/4]|uniref:Uncharacterized protein n=1 Tax=Natronoglomus mannanivorans TaxID=2979990 RepID=A0ABT2QL89_9EURY|nr:hypothetical protein [Halobacteria archaeon AArc-m2/3/4]